MWTPRAENAVEKKSGGNGLIAVAIDKDKGSQHALKWATEKLLYRGQTLILIHVVHRSSSSGANLHSVTSEVNGIVSPHRQNLEKQTKDLFRSFRCFCSLKDIHCHDVILEGTDIAKTIAEYVSCAAIDNLVLGATSRHGFIKRFKISDIPSQALKAAPDFCTIYVISKTKISSVRNASRPAPFNSPLHNQLQRSATSSVDSHSHSHSPSKHSYSLRAPLPADRSAPRSYNKGREVHLQDDTDSIRSPFNRGRASPAKLYREFSSETDTDISFVSSGRPSTDGRVSVSIYDTMDSAPTSRVSASSEGHSFGSVRLGSKWNEDFSASSVDSGRTSSSSQGAEEVEAEMRRLKLELKQTMEMYSTACKEALSAKQKALELHRWRVEEERRLEEARFAEESAMAMAETERAKCRAAMESAEAAQRIADMESQRRRNAELKYYEEEDEKVNEVEDKRSYQLRYRKYTIEEIEEATEYFSEARKIGEGGYGPVYRCDLDHTRVAVKVLRPDAAHGREQFQQEVEVLSCMRHPNMVLLLGACPEYGCLVYEYMANGSLEDRLFRRGNSRPLPWQLRFRIADEIATALLFLHQTKPEPLVHRDLKPGNILLDRNFVSKISDVGLARLVPPSVADDVTQYRMTSTAGTFCYIDPEYQQTGMLGVRSDVYSLGIVLLQLITAKPAMGLAHHVGRAIERGTFAEMLDPAVPDWPVEEALSYARVAVQCAELRRKDRPDLGKVVLPELNRLRDLADDMMEDHFFLGGSTGHPPGCSNPHSHALISSQNSQSQSQSQSQGVIRETYAGSGD